MHCEHRNAGEVRADGGGVTYFVRHAVKTLQSAHLSPGQAEAIRLAS